MVRNGALTSYSGAPSLINSQRLLGRQAEVSRQPKGTPTFHIRQPGRLQILWLARYALGKLATSGQPAAGPAVGMRTFQDYALYKWLRTRLPDHPCAAAAWPVITTNEIHRPRPVLYRFALALALARSLIDGSRLPTKNIHK